MSIILRSAETLRRGEATMAASIMGAYFECSPAIQDIIREMIDIINDDNSDQDDIDAALGTLFEALFPHAAAEICQIDDALFNAIEFKDAAGELDREQKEFSQRISNLSQARGVTEEQLAQSAGISQAAVVNILAGKIRPQRGTVSAFASALNVEAEELWPISTRSAET